MTGGGAPHPLPGLGCSAPPCRRPPRKAVREAASRSGRGWSEGRGDFPPILTNPGEGVGRSAPPSAFQWEGVHACGTAVVTDARNVPYGLGVWIASHYGLSVAFSLMAILIESTVIASIAVQDVRWRLLFFVECALLFAGFRLFQGITWPFWWVLTMTACLPWNWLDKPSAEPGPSPVTRVQAMVIATVVAIQVYASYTRTEIEPFMSNFP